VELFHSFLAGGILIFVRNQKLMIAVMMVIDSSDSSSRIYPINICPEETLLRVN
jgi:hypothetical protein